MVTLSAKTLALVISAIKELRETKGSTSREILNYITSVYNIPQESARRQMLTALKRGVAYGILKKNGVHYSLPTDTRAECQEIATQELGLLDMYCRRRQRKKKRSRGCKSRRKRGKRSSRRGKCKCKKRRKSSRRKKSRCRPKRSRCRQKKSRRSSKKRGCGCKKRGRAEGRDRSMSPRSKIERLSLNSAIESNERNDCENGSDCSTASIERRERGIPLSY